MMLGLVSIFFLFAYLFDNACIAGYESKCTHTHHSLTPINGVNLVSPINNVLDCRRKSGKPTQIKGEHINSTQNDPSGGFH